MIDPNMVMAVIATASIASPAVVAYFNNKTAVELKKLELKDRRQTVAWKATNRVNESRIQILTSFNSAVNDVVYDRSNEDAHTRMNALMPQLIALLDGDKQSRLLVLYDRLKDLNVYSSDENVKDGAELVTTFNKVMPEFVDYIRHMPVPDLPELPKLDK